MLSTTLGAYTLVALSKHPYDIGGSFVLLIVAKSEVNIWHSLCHRLAMHLTILDGLGLGSALSNVEGRYSDRATSYACDVVDAINMSYATLEVWALRVRCRMRNDCVVTRKCDSLSSHGAWRPWETTLDDEPLVEL
ncbi:unnamed protein product [Prunus armeniaca]